MEFRLLGPLEVLDGERAVPLGGPRQRSLLGALLLSPNQVVSSDRLIDAIWGEAPPASAQNLLQGYVSDLRKALGRDAIETRAPGYLLRADSGSRDVDQFEALVLSAREAQAAGNSQAAAEALRTALALWRGEPLADLTYEPFVQPEVARLEEARLGAVEARIEAELELGQQRELIGELEVLAARHPLRERTRELLMLALYRSGRQADALEVYRRTRELLVDELGLEPGPDLQELNRAVLAQDASLAAAPGGKPTRRRRAAPLPTAAHPLVDRQHELAALRGLVTGDSRLVTIAGPGGSGKTRLALELAHTLLPDFDQRVHFIGLAPLTDPALVPSAVAAALGVRETATEPLLTSLARAIGDDEVLLVLDNFEHVLDAALPTAELLALCPELRAVVTSRAPLRVSAEHEYPLEPLPNREAVELFNQRARAATPEFDAAPEMLAEICERLDRLPLALELAAARTKVLTPEELLARLDQRLDLLVAGPRDAPVRQQTLRAAVEWSYDLLDPDERRLFARLAVFAGGCTLDAAERVCGASLDALASLIDKSLLRRRGEPSRFWMLETIREYALERLDDTGAAEPIQRAHAEYLLELAEQAREHLRGPDQRDALRQLDAEIDNLRTAIAWSIEAEPGWAVRLTAALGQFWATRGTMREARRWLDDVVALPEVESAAGVTALLAAGNFASYAEEFERARALYERGLALSRSLQTHAIPHFLGALGRVAIVEGDLDRARTCFEEALTLLRGSGDRTGEAATLANLALTALEEDDLARADVLLEQGEAVLAEAGDAASLALLLPLRSYVRARQGDRHGAAELLARGLTLAAESGNRPATARGLVVGAFQLAETDPGRAAQLLAAADDAWAEFGIPPERFEAGVRAATATLVRPQLTRTSPEPIDLEKLVASLLQHPPREA